MPCRTPWSRRPPAAGLSRLGAGVARPFTACLPCAAQVRLLDCAVGLQPRRDHSVCGAVDLQQLNYDLAGLGARAGCSAGPTERQRNESCPERSSLECKHQAKQRKYARNRCALMHSARTSLFYFIYSLDALHTSYRIDTLHMHTLQ